jgi:hypothetical protein
MDRIGKVKRFLWQVFCNQGILQITLSIELLSFVWDRVWMCVYMRLRRLHTANAIHGWYNRDEATGARDIVVNCCKI